MTKLLVSNEKEPPQIFSATREGGKFRLTRREFCELAGMTVLACGLNACNLSNCPLVSLLASATPTATSTATPTSTPTPTSTSTPTPTPTDTPTLTPTSTPTATFTITPTPEIQSTIVNEASFRTGPGSAYPQIGKLPAGTKFLALGLSSDAGHTWVLVRVPMSALPKLNLNADYIEGWIPTYLGGYGLVKTLAPLPTVQNPDTPTPLPGQYGSAPKGQNNRDYTYTDTYGNKSYRTLKCGDPLPDGAVCTCDCVFIPVCQCDGYASPTAAPCGSDCGADTLTKPCHSPIPPGYRCTCDCI